MAGRQNGSNSIQDTGIHAFLNSSNDLRSAALNVNDGDIHHTNRTVSNIPSDFPGLHVGQHFRTKLCPAMFGSAGSECLLGERCTYAHSVSQLRRAPDLTKTKLCANYVRKKGFCSVDNCKWAHGRRELRSTDDFYKVTLCRYWMKGDCYASSSTCRHAHGVQELRAIPVASILGEKRELRIAAARSREQARSMAESGIMISNKQEKHWSQTSHYGNEIIEKNIQRSEYPVRDSKRQILKDKLLRIETSNSQKYENQERVWKWYGRTPVSKDENDVESSILLLGNGRLVPLNSSQQCDGYGIYGEIIDKKNNFSGVDFINNNKFTVDLKCQIDNLFGDGDVLRPNDDSHSHFESSPWTESSSSWIWTPRDDDVE